MAIIGYSACADRLSIQVQELARLDQFYNNLDNLYHSNIGMLYGEFNIEIPLRLEQSILWQDETKEVINEAAKEAASILNEVRVKPKPYEPKGIADVKEQVRVIQKAMLEDMTSDFVDCACPSFCEMERS